MSFMPRFRRVLRIERPDLESESAREVGEELSFHLERRARELMATGVSTADAERRAREEFGDLEAAAREMRRETRRAEGRRRLEATLDGVGRDLRFAARRLRRDPAFTSVAAITLALGIGSTTAVFTVLDAVLLRPLPLHDADRLVSLWHTGAGVGRERTNVSTGIYFTYLEENRAFEDLGLWDFGQFNLTGSGEPERLDHALVTHQILPILGVQPAAGRFFTSEDDRPGQPLRAVISHGLWQARFGGDPEVVGRTLGASTEIIGVLPASFRFPAHRADVVPDVLFPFRLDRSEAIVGRLNHQAIARLRPGVTAEDAARDMQRMLPLSIEKFGGSPDFLERVGLAPLVRPLKTDVVGEIHATLWIVFGAVALLLAIACINVANLFLVRTESRNREVAVRAALGAGRSSAVRELAIEASVLGFLGVGLGLGLALGGLEVLKTIASQPVPRIDEIGLDGRVLAFSIAVTFLSVLGLGLLPAARVAHPDLVAAMGGRNRSSSPTSRRSRGLLVSAQVALALVLLVGAGLMVRSFQALQGVPPGFDRPERILTFRLSIPSSEVAELEEAVDTHGRIVERIETVPGVAVASVANSAPLLGFNNNNSVYVADRPLETGETAPSIRQKFILPGYFETMGNPLLAGRAIGWDDVRQKRSVAVVTEDFALAYWERPEDALGRMIMEGAESSWKEIVGVVGPVHDDALDRGSTPIVYWPLMVSDFWGMREFGFRTVSYAVRSDGPAPATLLGGIRQAVWAVNPDLPLADVQTMAEIVGRSTSRTSFALVLLGVAAGIALILGLVGLYGVISYSVTARRREIGIRMALGARGGGVTRMVVRQGLVLAGLGVAAGLLMAVAATRLMGSLLFGVTPLDPPTYALAATALAVVAFAASYVPARRAAAVDPIRTLREE